jgi:hypothetical protein
MCQCDLQAAEAAATRSCERRFAARAPISSLAAHLPPALADARARVQRNVVGAVLARRSMAPKGKEKAVDVEKPSRKRGLTFDDPKEGKKAKSKGGSSKKRKRDE